MKNIDDFCDKKGVPITIRSAFQAYCKTDYAQTFELAEGDTITRIIANLTQEQVADAWNKFILEFKSLIQSK